MKYVKCMNPFGVNLTHQKIYEVKSLYISDWSNLTYIIIINDVGVECTYDIHTSFLLLDYTKIVSWFEDATAEVRQNKLKELGI